MATINNAIDSKQALSPTSNVTFATVTANTFNGQLVSANGYSQVTVSTTATLTSTAFGKQVLCTGASPYVVTLPAVASNVYIDFNILTTSSALVSITPASGTIQGRTKFVLGTGESCRVYGDGTNWWIENVSLMPITYSGYLATSPTMATNAYTIMPALTLITGFDPQGYMSSNTYTPLYPGQYEFMLEIIASLTTVSTDALYAVFYLNGSIYSSSYAGSGGNNGCLSINTDVLKLNGSTDYMQPYYYNATSVSGGTMEGVQASSHLTALTIKRINNIV